MNGNSKCVYLFLNDLKVIACKITIIKLRFEHMKFVLFVHAPGGYIGLESRNCDRGVTQTVTYCHRGIGGCRKLVKIASHM